MQHFMKDSLGKQDKLSDPEPVSTPIPQLSASADSKSVLSKSDLLNQNIKKLSEEIAIYEAYNANAFELINRLIKFDQVFSNILELTESIIVNLSVVISHLNQYELRHSVVAELQNILIQLCHETNACDSDGDYLFSGSMQNISSFQLSQDVYQYQGTQNGIAMAISPGCSFEFTLNGSQVFGIEKTLDSEIGSDNILNVLTCLIGLLREKNLNENKDTLIFKCDNYINIFKKFHEDLSQYKNEFGQQKNLIHVVIKNNQSMIQDKKEILLNDIANNIQEAIFLLNEKLNHLELLNEAFLKMQPLLTRIITL